MYPTIRNQEKILVKKTNLSQIFLRDIIIFRKKRQYICHRVIKIDKNNNIIYTKGDFNFWKKEKVKAKDILGKVIGVYRKDKLKYLKFENTFLYYIFVNFFSFLKESTYLFTEILYSSNFFRKLLKKLFPLKKVKYILVRKEEEEILFRSFYNIFFPNPSWVILYKLVAVIEKIPIGKLWILKDKNSHNILFLGPYVKLLYRARGVGSHLIKKGLEVVKKRENIYIYIPSSYKNKQLLNFSKKFRLKIFLSNNSLTVL